MEFSKSLKELQKEYVQKNSFLKFMMLVFKNRAKHYLNYYTYDKTNIKEWRLDLNDIFDLNQTFYGTMQSEPYSYDINKEINKKNKRIFIIYQNDNKYITQYYIKLDCKYISYIGFADSVMYSPVLFRQLKFCGIIESPNGGIKTGINIIEYLHKNNFIKVYENLTKEYSLAEIIYNNESFLNYLKLQEIKDV